MKIEVNISKKYFFSILAVILVLGAVIGVVAYNSNPANPSVFGHSANEIEGAVSQIVAGSGIAVNPAGGTGAVTVSATAVGGSSGLYDYSQCVELGISGGGTSCPVGSVGIWEDEDFDMGYCCKLKDPSKIDFTNTRFTSDDDDPCNYDEVVTGWKVYGFKCAKRISVSPSYTCQRMEENRRCDTGSFYRGKGDASSDPSSGKRIYCCPA